MVIFTSDHGYGLGERGHWGKGSLYEIDARVPLIVRDPHQPAGRGKSCAHLVELVDLYKSVVDLANLPFSRTLYTWLEGHSLRPSLARPRGHARRRDVAAALVRGARRSCAPRLRGLPAAWRCALREPRAPFRPEAGFRGRYDAAWTCASARLPGCPRSLSHGSVCL